MNIETINITPALAAKMLGGNTHNRPIRNRQVDKLTAAILAGEWKLNGDAIRFNGDGKLIDGQHRLQACIKAKKTIRTLVIKDLPEDVFDTIDIGAQRSGADTLGALGEKNCHLIASALRAVHRVITGNPSGGRLTNVEIRLGLGQHPGIRDSATFCQNLPTMKRLIPPSWIAALHYLFSKKDPTLGSLFFSTLEDGSNLTANDPIFVLRQRLISNNLSNAKLPEYHVGALIIKSWNALRNDEKVKYLRWSREEPNCEPFPKIK